MRPGKRRLRFATVAAFAVLAAGASAGLAWGAAASAAALTPIKPL